MTTAWSKRGETALNVGEGEDGGRGRRMAVASPFRRSSSTATPTRSRVSQLPFLRLADKSVLHRTLVTAMPPMAFTGLVTKVGFIDKTATVTVSRFVTHPKVGKVCRACVAHDSCSPTYTAS